MRIVVNGQEIPQGLVEEELRRVRISPRLSGGPVESRNDAELQAMAEDAAINRVVLEMAADSDPRPIPSTDLQQAIEGAMRTYGCAAGPEPPGIRPQAERHLRIQRLVGEFTASVPQPSQAEIENFYTAQRENFRRPESFHAAHIVRSVDHLQTEEQALAAIQVAQAELARGDDFGGVAQRHSNCEGNGDLGWFPAGKMVDEFERAIRELQPGQRTGIFTTPFGYHIAELRARRSGEQAQFEQVREDIARVLTAMREHEATLAGIARLRERVTVERFLESADAAGIRP